MFSGNRTQELVPFHSGIIRTVRRRVQIRPVKYCTSDSHVNAQGKIMQNTQLYETDFSCLHLTTAFFLESSTRWLLKSKGDYRIGNSSF